MLTLQTSLPQVCRLLRELVTKSDELQYTVELAIAGCENGHGTLSFAERRTCLRAHREAWRYVRWTDETVVPAGSSTGYCTVHDGIVASQIAHKGRTLAFTQIPSATKGVKHRVWEVTVQPSIHTFMVDASQGLLIVVEKKQG